MHVCGASKAGEGAEVAERETKRGKVACASSNRGGLPAWIGTAQRSTVLATSFTALLG